jgi:DNA-binding CsgD family transcriptional regulator
MVAEPAESSLEAMLLAKVLDEIDYGIAIVSAEGRVLHANVRARAEFGEDRPLRLARDQLQARRPADQSALAQALQAVRKCRRTLLAIGEQASRISIAVVPIEAAAGEDCRTAALVFQKRLAFEALTLSFFARTHRLTSAETIVLEALCRGLRPQQIASQQGVAISTVRTQVSSIRAKTQTGSMRELVQTLSTLPPLTPAMKMLTH